MYVVNFFKMNKEQEESKYLIRKKEYDDCIKFIKSEIRKLMHDNPNNVRLILVDPEYGTYALKINDWFYKYEIERI